MISKIFVGGLSWDTTDGIAPSALLVWDSLLIYVRGSEGLFLTVWKGEQTFNGPLVDNG